MVAVTRRQVLAGMSGGALLAAFGGWRGLLDSAAGAVPTTCAPLSDIEHVVFLIQENRAFDHYFGSLRGVRGFADPGAVFADGSSSFGQPDPESPTGRLFPFHLDTATTRAECTNDISHSWGPQHRYWNAGAMDRFVTEHIAVDGSTTGPMAMGYYTRDDLAFYYALAEAFTICDAYHCSVIGPTDPNRLYTMSATIDPDGRNGGPLLETLTQDRPRYFGRFTWQTMPEALTAAGVSWKVYQTPDGQLDDVLPYFKAYQQDPNLAANAFVPTYPGTFEVDVAAGTLPQVTWLIAPVAQSEHPAAPPAYGEDTVAHVLATLVANPAVWEKTALFVTYDENGGFFDHVPPPTAPAGTPGEYLTVSPLPAGADGIAGPIGLGFRVPMLAVSPYSRGGLVCSTTLDHTSMLRFLETRFGVTVPNLSAWRRSVTGDLTEAFNFAAAKDTGVPALPATSPVDQRVLTECIPDGITGTADQGPAYPFPYNDGPPAQETGTAAQPSGVAACSVTTG